MHNIKSLSLFMQNIKQLHFLCKYQIAVTFLQIPIGPGRAGFLVGGYGRLGLITGGYWFG